jgi:deoxyinosine 3'endonuclease (endonuclease V)
VAGKATFPYVPGLLSFREAPIVLEAFRRLTTVPDVVLCDGQGLAHPRRIGLASHLGLWLEVPTIGCAKSVFLHGLVRSGLAADEAPSGLRYRWEVGQQLEYRSSSTFKYESGSTTVQACPTLILIGPDGTVRDFHIGTSPTLHEDVGKTIRELLPSK